MGKGLMILITFFQVVMSYISVTFKLKSVCIGYSGICCSGMHSNVLALVRHLLPNLHCLLLWLVVSI